MDVTSEITAEGKKFSFLPESEIKTDELNLFKFYSINQLIITETKEFSAVCPFSGNVGIYQEGATKRIYDDVKNVLQSDRVRVTTIYNTRGGFDTTCIEGTL